MGGIDIESLPSRGRDLLRHHIWRRLSATAAAYGFAGHQRSDGREPLWTRVEFVRLRKRGAVPRGNGRIQSDGLRVWGTSRRSGSGTNSCGCRAGYFTPRTDDCRDDRQRRWRYSQTRPPRASDVCIEVS